MKKFFLILLIVLTAGALIFYYFIREDDSSFNTWQLVPSHAAIVLETKSPEVARQKFLDSKIGEGYKKTELHQNTTSFFAEVDTMAGMEGAAAKLLSNPMLISAVPTAQNQYELLYIVPVGDPQSKNIINEIAKSILNKRGHKINSRYYQGLEIKELVTDGKAGFAMIRFKDHLVASKSSFLVEMVIRLINSEYRDNFKNNNIKLFSLPTNTGDAGNIYYNFEQLSRFLGVFSSQQYREFFNPLTEMNGGGVLDLSFSETGAILNGFSILYDSGAMLTSFPTENRERLNVINYIPGNTQYLLNYRINNTIEGHKEVAKWIGKDITFLTIPSLRSSTASQVLFVDALDPGEAMNYFNSAAEKAAKEDTVYREHYAGYPLTEIVSQEWPLKFFPKLYTKTDNSFFTKIGSYFVLSNDLEALKVIIEDLENENSWGKNIDLRQYFGLGLEEANISLVVHPENYWNSLTESMNNTWKSEFKANDQFLRGFKIGLLQLNYLEDKYYTSVVFGYEPREDLNDGNRNLKPRFVKSFTNEFATRPYVVKNHENNGFEVLVQDVNNNLSLIDWEGRVLWTDSVSEVINKDVIQIDFYKNNKLQYFFTGSNKLFLIDRNGNKVENYPITIGKNPIAFATAIDYDNSKNYRFLIADTQGSIYMLDKHGNILDGWTPNKLQGAFSSKPFHVRVRAKDYIVAVQKRGIIHVMNRRGEPYKGFPIDLDSRVTGEIFLQKGTDAEGTVITVVTESGQLIKLNLAGKIISKENLYRATRESKFHLVPQVQNNGFIIVREGLNRVAILDEKGDRKFEKDYLSVDPLNIQYYNFGSEKEIIAFTDTAQQFSYLYNESGDLINNQPLNSADQVSLLYFNSTKKFHLFKVYNNTISALTF